MTVRELIEKLGEAPDHAEVWVRSSDGSMNPASGVELFMGGMSGSKVEIE